MTIRSLEQLLVVGIAAGLLGCAPIPIADEEGAAQLGELATAGNWNAVVNASIRCSERGDACAKQYAAKGDACLRLAIQQPQSASVRDNRTQKLLDCAVESYRNALQQAPSDAPSRTSYHGGLLLTLSEQRNRLDSRTPDSQRERNNETLLMAAQDARREVPSSALGYLYGASAHVYRAALKPDPRHRCSDLRQAESMLKRSPPPPPTLADEAARLKSLVARQLRESRCPTIRRR